MNEKSSRPSRPWLKPLLILGVLGLVAFAIKVANMDFSGVSVETVKEKIESFGIWGPVAYIVFYQVRPLILFPAGVLSAAAGVIFGLPQGLLYLLIAADIQAVVEFLIARYAARDWVTRIVKGRIEHIDRAIERRGFVTVLLIRLIPNLPWDVQNLGLGVSRVKLRDYVAATVVGIIPGSFTFVYLGNSFIEVVADPKNFWKILVAVALFAGIFFLQKVLRKKKGASMPADGRTDPEAASSSDSVTV